MGFIFTDVGYQDSRGGGQGNIRGLCSVIATPWSTTHCPVHNFICWIYISVNIASIKKPWKYPSAWSLSWFLLVVFFMVPASGLLHGSC